MISLPPMLCPKCRTENPETVLFCVRCHTPLKYTCPACQHVQRSGGTCEKCGVDFAKYAAMLLFRAQTQAEAKRAQSRERVALWKQVILIPVTGGLSLLKFFRAKAKGK